MANLLGDVWGDDAPYFERALKEPATYLHLYGKQSARPGRKMGHITKLADTVEQAACQVVKIRDAIRCSPPTLF